MSYRVAIYQVKADGGLYWLTLGLGDANVEAYGKTALKLQRDVSQMLRMSLTQKTAAEASRFFAPRGLELHRVHLALTLKDAERRKVSGVFPLVVEPRWATRDRRIVLAYHPRHQSLWFPVREDRPLDEQATLYFTRAFAELSDDELGTLTTNKKDLITSIAFEAEHMNVISELPDREEGIWDDLTVKTDHQPPRRSLDVLLRIGVNQTTRAIEGSLPSGAPRRRFREPMLLHLAGEKRKPLILVGPPGCGKTTIFNHFVKDLVDNDDFGTHKNLDRIHNVWATSGKRLIAGQSLVGQWEERVNQLVAELRGKKLILFIEDIAAFGRIGRTRDSDRSLADAFRGPLERGEILLVGEATPEEIAQLEDDAPSFANLFTRLFVTPTDRELTYQIMFFEAQRLELAANIAFDAEAYRTIFELSDSLFPSAAFPGKAVDLLRELAKPQSTNDERRIGPQEVLTLLSEKTGLPMLLLQPEQPLDKNQLGRQLERYVMGQPAAVDAAVDVVLRIRAGLTDPLRPYAVYLFTGPTGTGKTELAKCIAEYLYGTKSRLLRLDMSELSGPDAVVRLVGDRFQPEGILTQPVRDQPFCVVLLDEVEKAHPSVLNLLLQLFDEGRLTDARGQTADFKHTVVVMTSNLGARARPAVGFARDPRADAMRVDEAVRAFFPPELFNRIDRIVPFAPLDESTAMQIAEKELSRLVTRRGLTERSIFVFAGEDVLRRVVREGFDVERGARPLQRYLEDRIGAPLTDHITRTGPTAMQIVRVYPGREGFRLETEVLREVEPKPVTYALTRWLDKPVDEALAGLDEARQVLEQIVSSGGLERLADRIAATISDPNAQAEVYHLDALRLRLEELSDRLEISRASRNAQDPDLLEATQFTYDSHVTRSHTPEARHRAFDLRAMTPKAPSMSKDEIFNVIAEAQFLRRAFERVHEAGRHAVFVELLRVGQARHRGRFGGPESGLLESLARAYLDGPGELTSFACRTFDGRIIARETDDEDAVPLDRAPVHLVLEISGLAILDHFEPERGCHVWQSLASGTELVRVDAWPVERQDSAKDVVARFLEAQQAYELAIRQSTDDETLVHNPSHLLGAIRKLRYEPSKGDNRPIRFEIEDYATAEVTVRHARTLADALRPQWLLRKSRVGR